MKYWWLGVVLLVGCERYGDRPLPELTRGFQIGFPALVEGVYRYYDIYVPENVYNGPAVILLGDYGESVDSLVIHSPRQHPFHAWKEIADREKIVLVYPWSIPNSMGHHAWNDCRQDNQAFPIYDNLFIYELMNEVRGRFLINLNEVYLCGTGNGGMMALRVAHEIGYLAAVAISGAGKAFPNQCIDIELPTHLLVVHGEADPYVPYWGGQVTGTPSTVAATSELIADWAKRNGCKPTTEVALPDLDTTDGCQVWQQDYSSCTTGKQLRFLRIVNGGHAIPSKQFVHQSALIPMGNQCRDVEFAEVAWTFFSGKTFR